jgi:hypothetical protein
MRHTGVIEDEDKSNPSSCHVATPVLSSTPGTTGVLQKNDGVPDVVFLTTHGEKIGSSTSMRGGRENHVGCETSSSSKAARVFCAHSVQADVGVSHVPADHFTSGAADTGLSSR